MHMLFCFFQVVRCGDIFEHTLKPMAKKSVPYNPWVEIEWFTMLRAKEVRVLKVRAAELMWMHAQRCMVHSFRKHQFGVWVERAACGALIAVQKTVSGCCVA